MLKISAIAFTIIVSSAASVIHPGALSNMNPYIGSTGAAQESIAGSAPARMVQRFYYQTPKCQSVKRQITVYSRALSRLDMAHESHRRVVPIYHQARQSESDWYDRNCR